MKPALDITHVLSPIDVHSMINVEEALALVLNRVRAKSPELVALEQALGLVLAEDVASDIDSPPHDKSLVDGYALLADDAKKTPVELHVIEEVTAGATPTRPVTTGSATRIMTGAPIPDRADAVVMVERTESVDAATVRLLEQQVFAGQHIMRRATSLRRDEVVLSQGTLARPIEVGLLAEVGRSQVAVIPRPNVAVLSTGNELVPVGHARRGPDPQQQWSDAGRAGAARRRPPDRFGDRT